MHPLLNDLWNALTPQEVSFNLYKKLKLIKKFYVFKL